MSGLPYTQFKPPVWLKQIAVALVLLFSIVAHAQTVNDTAAVRKAVAQLNNYNSKFTSEKIYLHFDKPYYAAGDTIWFKAYLLNAASLKASAYSNKLYIDLISDSSSVVQSLAIPVATGLGYGDIKLPAKMHDGAYTLRAYTNWQQNFGPASFFQQRFYIGKPDNNNWLLSEQHQAGDTPAGKQVTLAMQLKSLSGLPVVNEGITLRVLEGRRGIIKNDLLTAVDGRLNTNFVLPPNTDTRKLSLLLVSKQDKGKTIRMPFYPGGGADIDLQFMPEGGSMVAGLYNKIGFKAIGEDGLGVDVEGTIMNSRGEEVSTFKSLHKGMGWFAMSPVAGEKYVAKLKMVSGTEKSYPLPLPQASGVALRADAVSDKDNIRVYITTMPDRAGNSGYTLLVSGMDTVYFGKAFNFTDGYYNTLVPKAWFRDGILNFMIVGADNKPLSSRSVYINQSKHLVVSATPDKPVYAANDSVSINLNVTDRMLNPIMANFSVSVTDDAQVKNDLRATHIESYLLLSSELKGNIEDPDWYFDAAHTDAPKALDNLLLTQGWKGFNPDKAFATPVPQPAFWAEADNSVTGKLINFFGKPVVNYPVTLLSNRKGMLVVDTMTNQEGRFTFNNLPFSDTTAYFIKVHNKRGKEAAVGFDVREFQPAPVGISNSIMLTPWNVNTDPALLFYSKNSQQRVNESVTPAAISGTLLKEVNIKANRKASLKGEAGEDVYFADADIDEKELAGKGNISLLNYLLKYVPGFHEKSSGLFTFFAMKGNWVMSIIVDGIPIGRYYMGVGNYYDFFSSVLDNTPAAGVKKVVIYHKILPSGKDWVAYVMVQTRNGNGPVLKATPGVYIYRPQPLYIAREFYRPRYDVKAKTQTADLRSTIYWQPNVVTDSTGHASFSFYAAGKSSTYSVVVEGTDMQGHFGVSTTKITIAQNAGTGRKQSP